jgi:hypothetical protein
MKAEIDETNFRRIVAGLRRLATLHDRDDFTRRDFEHDVRTGHGAQGLARSYVGRPNTVRDCS